MKKIALILSVFSILLISSCGGDDEEATPQIGLSGTINYNGVSYSIANGILTQSSSSGGTEVQFYLADGTIALQGNSVSSSDSQIIVAIQAVSVGTSTLEAGNYETSRQVTNKYAFVTVTTSDISGNQSFVGGSIDISGSDKTFSLTFNDVPFSQGVELTGSVSGTFE